MKYTVQGQIYEENKHIYILFILNYANMIQHITVCD